MVFFLRLKATKMRFFFKRWLDFETKWGDEQSGDLPDPPDPTDPLELMAGKQSKKIQEIPGIPHSRFFANCGGRLLEVLLFFLCVFFCLPNCA